MSAFFSPGEQGESDDDAPLIEPIPPVIRPRRVPDQMTPRPTEAVSRRTSPGTKIAGKKKPAATPITTVMPQCSSDDVTKSHTPLTAAKAKKREKTAKRSSTTTPVGSGDASLALGAAKSAGDAIMQPAASPPLPGQFHATVIDVTGTSDLAECIPSTFAKDKKKRDVMAQILQSVIVKAQKTKQSTTITSGTLLKSQPVTFEVKFKSTQTWGCKEYCWITVDGAEVFEYVANTASDYDFTNFDDGYTTKGLARVTAPLKAAFGATATSSHAKCLLEALRKFFAEFADEC